MKSILNLVVLGMLSAQLFACSAEVKTDGGPLPQVIAPNKAAPQSTDPAHPVVSPPAAPANGGDSSLVLPPVATGVSNAHSVHCSDANAEFYVNFPDQKLQQDPTGLFTGDVGVLTWGYRLVGGASAFKTYKTDYPSLIINGPTASILFYDNDARVGGQFKSSDFVTGDAEFHAPDYKDTDVRMNCKYYQSVIK